MNRLEKPKQKNSRATLLRIQMATQRIARERSFDEISINEILSEADVTVGSFYARFGTKKDLLVYLYQIYLDGVDEQLDVLEVENIAAQCHRDLAENMMALASSLTTKFGLVIRSSHTIMGLLDTQELEQAKKRVTEINTRFLRSFETFGVSRRCAALALHLLKAIYRDKVFPKLPGESAEHEPWSDEYKTWLVALIENVLGGIE